MTRTAHWLPILVASVSAAPVAAQSINPARLAVLLAEQRRATNATDLATLRDGVRSSDSQTARLAVRAIGRLERPSLIPVILPMLDHRASEVRAEAANALAQASRGGDGGSRSTITQVLDTMVTRLADEPSPDVRGSLAESIGRLPYQDERQALRAQTTLVELARSSEAELTDRVAATKGLEVYARVQRDYPLQADTLALLRRLARGASLEVEAAPSGNGATLADAAREVAEPKRSARVRRLALEALLTEDAVDEDTVARAIDDVDPQVRRLAMRGAKRADLLGHLMRGLVDASPWVRLEAVRGLPEAAGSDACQPLAVAAADTDPHVALQALDRLGRCGQSDAAIGQLTQVASDAASIQSPSRWHRPARALVALAAAAPDRARPLVARYRTADNPFVRAYVARAAARLGDWALLERFADDPDDNVVEAAIDGLSEVAGSAATDVFVAALKRQGFHVLRAAARALKGTTPRDTTVAALRSALERLTAARQANSLDARAALIDTLTALGQGHLVRDEAVAAAYEPPTPLTLEELRRLASRRLRVIMRGHGTFDLALITHEAPAAVLHVVRLAESGFYNGLTFHRVEPNFVIQGGSPAANEYVGHPDHMRDEVGLWPHVRGAVGISTRGRDTGDAQLFIDLVDNPRLDHQYTVFAYVVSGMDVVDRILEGDVIEKVVLVAP